VSHIELKVLMLSLVKKEKKTSDEVISPLRGWLE